MKYNYDTVAPVYDRLARLIYGRKLADAQVWLLQRIPPGSHVLIVGGGTGWVLDEINKLHQGLTITYVDTSAKMIALAKKRAVHGNRITFIAAPIEEAGIDDLYDVVLTPFLFDNFRQEMAERVFAVVDKLLKKGGLWLYCDFRGDAGAKHGLMLRIMYVFFRVLCGVRADRLPDMAQCFVHGGYVVQAREVFMDGFVESVVYQLV